jgi:hypothetical protein
MRITIQNPITKLYNKRALEKARTSDFESLVWMKPQTFLNLASPMRKYAKEKHQRVRKLLSERAEIVDLPYFKLEHLEGKTFKITAHEGRHRNTYLNIAHGDHLMPVRLLPTNFDMDDFRRQTVTLIAQQSEKRIQLVL